MTGDSGAQQRRHLGPAGPEARRGARRGGGEADGHRRVPLPTEVGSAQAADIPGHQSVFIQLKVLGLAIRTWTLHFADQSVVPCRY